MSARAYLRDLARYLLMSAFRPKTVQFRGLTVPVDATDQLRRIRKRIYRGRHELPEILALEGFLRPDDIVLEAGAGCGVVTSVMARSLATSGNVHTYEADAALLPSIRAVADANGLKPTINHGAIGLEDGSVTFFVDDDFRSSSTVDRGRNARKVEAPSLSLPRLIDEIRPTVLMIDIEGGETILSEIRYPAHVRAILMEVHPHVIGDAAITAIARSLFDQGFSMVVDRCGWRCLVFEREIGKVGEAAVRPPLAAAHA